MIAQQLARAYQTEDDLRFWKQHLAAAAKVLGRDDAMFSDQCCRCGACGHLWRPLADPDAEYLCGRCVLAEHTSIPTPSVETIGC